MKFALLTSWLWRPPLLDWFKSAMLLCIWRAAYDVGDMPPLSCFSSIILFIDWVFLIFIASIWRLRFTIAFELISFEYSGLYMWLILMSKSIVSGAPSSSKNWCCFCSPIPFYYWVSWFVNCASWFAPFLWSAYWPLLLSAAEFSIAMKAGFILTSLPCTYACGIFDCTM